MSFPWLERSTPKPSGAGAERRTEVARTELAHRAALLYRLGFSVEDATKRLCDRVAWEYDPAPKGSPHCRPDGLSDAEISKIVSETYARRP